MLAGGGVISHIHDFIVARERERASERQRERKREKERERESAREKEKRERARERKAKEREKRERERETEREREYQGHFEPLHQGLSLSLSQGPARLQHVHALSLLQHTRLVNFMTCFSSV